MTKVRMYTHNWEKVGILLLIVVFGIFIQVIQAASPNDACFASGCHDSTGSKPINRTLYDSNPHKIIKCIECHENSIDPGNDSNHGQFIRQLNGSKITGPLTTSYNSQNFSLCYFCHAEKNVVGILPGWIPSSNHVNLTPILVSSIGSNFINVDPKGYHIGSQTPGVFDIPTNIHWNHLDAFGSIKAVSFGLFDSNMDGITDSYQSCPACHNVHGTNYPKMTKNDLAITYGNDSNGTFGYIGSDAYLNSGGDVYCTGCHNSGTTFKYYRNEINLYEDCVSCHVDGAPGNVNRTAFSQGVHVNINNSDGNGLVNNSDCWTCHFNRDMNRSNIRQCADCHTGNGIPDAPTAPKIRTHVSGLAITNYSCVDCHSKVINDPGTGVTNVTSHYLKRPTVPTVNYCDYCHGPNASSPFSATNKTIPAFSHDDPGWNGNATCRTCHSNSSVSADPLANNTSSFHDLTTELGDVYNGTTKADCVLCHVQKAPQFVAAPSPSHDTSGYTAVDCRGCHTTGAGTDPQKLHSVTAFATGGCIACHSNNATRFFVDTSLFGRHANVNATGGTNNVTDDDCKTCHFGAANGTMKMVLGAANSTNTWFCEDCHTGSGKPVAPTAPKITTHTKTNYSCVDCHSKVLNGPGTGSVNVTSHYLKRPVITTPNYCDYCHGPNATAPFPATNKTIPAFNHDDPSWNGNATCRTCHSNSSVSADPLANDTSSFHDLTTELGDVYNGTTKADCVLCHVQKAPQFVAAPSPPHDTSGYIAVDCRGCHTTGAGTDPQKIHSVTAFATGGCIACHSNNATRFFVDTSLFGRHANVNATGGTNNVTDDDCKTCHFGAANGTMKMVLGAANSTNTWFCDACHTSAGSGPIKPTDPNLFKNGLSHGSTNCQWCHIAGDPLPRPLDSTLRYHPNGPRGTAAGKNCLTCHYNPAPTELLFHAPLEKHESDMNICDDCHDQASNHGVTPDPDTTNPPKVISLSVTTPVSSGTGSQINATISDDWMLMGAARYQVTNSSGIVLDWTDMNPIIGFEYVNAIINTSGLLGNYNVNVKGMAWAPKVDGSKPYYPLNGRWGGISTVQLNVTQLAYNSTTPSITSVTITPTNPSAGNEINITVAINNPGASFNGRVEGNVWAPDGTGKYLGWENVVIPSGASTVTIIGPAGGAESGYITHQAGTYLYDVFLENVDKGQVYLNPTDSRRGVPFSVGAAADVYISNVELSASPTVGSIMTLKVTIFNPTSSAFTGTMDANIWDSVRGYALTPQSISIAAGGSTTLTFSYSPVNHGLHSYDFFMVSDISGQNTKAPWGFPCMDYVAGIGFNVV